MIKTLDGSAFLILVNAIYFKGKWKYQFNKQDTLKEFFFLGKNSKVKVPMMNIEGQFKMKKDETLENVKVLQIPYENDEMNMYILLPGEDLSSLESKLAFFDNERMIDFLKMDSISSETVNLKLPKFKLETSIDFKKILLEMGLKSSINHPDLKNMLCKQPENTNIKSIIQKALIEVRNVNIILL